MSKKVALVTGGMGGLGTAICKALAQAGYTVAANCLPGFPQKDEWLARTKAEGFDFVAAEADVADFESCAAMVQQLEASVGPVDILVNNAGSLVERLRLLELTEEKWDAVIDLNLKSAFLCAQAVAASMIERKVGTIINVTSIAGRNGGALGSIHYSTAKGGMITLTKGLAKELAPHGVRVNAVSPGVIDTPFHEQFSTPEAMKNFTNIIPLGRVGRSDEVGQTVVYLASEASSFVIGENIEINGGMLMD